jgi:hypothetical protein
MGGIFKKMSPAAMVADSGAKAMSLSPIAMALDKKKKQASSSSKSVIKPRNLLEPNLNESNGGE